LAHLKSQITALLLAIPVAGGFATTITAQTNTPAAQELQALDCAWWNYVTKFAYEDFEVFERAKIDDPIGELKYRLDYDSYHEFSAGRAILDAVFEGIDQGDPVKVSQQGVAALCNGFPAEAVNPDNISAPMLGETL